MGGFRNTLHMNGAVAVIRNNKGDILVDGADASTFRTHNLYIHARGDTVTVAARCKETGEQTKLSRLILGVESTVVVDHINGNALDNRRRNLRAVTQQQNRRNSIKPRVASTSRYKGVCKPAGRTLWHANIYDRKLIRLGTFATEIEAAHAYDDAARELFGACAALNFPREGEQSAHRTPTATLENARAAIDAQLAKLRPVKGAI